MPKADPALLPALSPSLDPALAPASAPLSVPALVPAISIVDVRAARLEAAPLLLSGAQILHHVYNSSFPADSFNPGFGSGRFHPFKDASGALVPIYYAASSEEGSYCETLFRAVGDGRMACRQVAGKLLANNSYARVRLQRSLALANLSGNQLLRLGVTRAALLEPGPLHYADTAAWAAAIHTACPDLHGLAWTSRQHDASTCLMFFGDRVRSDDLEVLSTLDLATLAGRAQAELIAYGMGIVVTR